MNFGWKRTMKNTLGITAAKSGRVKKWSELFDSAVFPGTQGGPLMHIIAGKAVAYQEALKPEFKSYQQQVLNNARAMGEQFTELGYNLISRRNRQPPDSDRLAKQGRNRKTSRRSVGQSRKSPSIKTWVPFDTESPFVTSGIRIGAPAMTTRGLNEIDFTRIARLIDPDYLQS